MTDGLACAKIVVETAGYLREVGQVQAIPPFLVWILRRDGQLIVSAVFSDADLEMLIATLTPDSSVEFRRGMLH